MGWRRVGDGGSCTKREPPDRTDRAALLLRGLLDYFLRRLTASTPTKLNPTSATVPGSGMSLMKV